MFRWSLRGFLIAFATMGVFFATYRSHSYAPLSKSLAAAVTFLLVGGLSWEGIAALRRSRQSALERDVSFTLTFQGVYLLTCAVLLAAGFWRELITPEGYRPGDYVFHVHDSLLVLGGVLGLTASMPPPRRSQRRWSFVGRCVVCLTAMVAIALMLYETATVHALVYVAVTSVQLAQPTQRSGIPLGPLPTSEAYMDRYVLLAAAAGVCWLVALGLALRMNQHWSNATERRWYVLGFVLACGGCAGLCLWWIGYGNWALSPFWEPNPKGYIAWTLVALMWPTVSAFLAFRLTIAEADPEQRLTAEACTKRGRHRGMVFALLYVAIVLYQILRTYGLWDLDPLNLPLLLLSPAAMLLLAVLAMQVRQVGNSFTRTPYPSAFDLPLSKRRFLALWGMIGVLLAVAAPLAGWSGMALHLAMRR